MLDSITKGLAKVFGGTKTEKDLKLLHPYVGKINAEYEKLRSITDDALRNRTTELKAVIKERLNTIDEQIQQLQKKVEEQPDLDVQQKEELFSQIALMGLLHQRHIKDQFNRLI